MAGQVEKDEKGETESPQLQIDPNSFKEALRAFFQPIKNDDPRLDFYTMYKREATEYDMDYVRKFDEDLNTTLIFAGLFSAVSSAFVIDVYAKLRPDPSEQSAALLRAILLTLNHSAIPTEAAVIPPVQENPPGDIVTATCLLYVSLLVSLLAAFVAMLGKQWLNRYLRHAGGSMIERCGDRQLKCDGLQKWPFHFFVETLPVMLQIALLLLACGLCRYMVPINTSVAYTLVGFAGLGVLFYIGIVIAGTSSYECPFQTPASVPLRSLWTKVTPRFIFIALPVLATLRILGGTIRDRTLIIHSSLVGVSRKFRGLFERVRLRTPRLRLPWTGPTARHHFPRPLLPTDLEVRTSPNPRETTTWFAPNELATIKLRNNNDARCVSWVLRNTTDPEALDAAIRLTGTVRWFEDGIGAEPPYELIVATFHTCFGSDRRVYPGSRDRAYCAGQAILWIYTLAVCRSEEFSRTFPLPTTQYTAPGSDPDLTHLLQVTSARLGCLCFTDLLQIYGRVTPSHVEWTSNLLLHLSWAAQGTLDFNIGDWAWFTGNPSVQTRAILNCILMFCNFLGSPIGEDVLRIEDKSDRIEQILNQVSGAIIPIANPPRPQLEPTWGMLLSLTTLENRPWCLTEMAYGWGVATWENFGHRGHLFLLPWAIGFRHLDPQDRWLSIDFAHDEHPQELIDEVFKTGEIESIADLLQALTVKDSSGNPARTSLGHCTRHIVDLSDSVSASFPRRLRRLVIRSIPLIGCEGFEEVVPGRFVELLNHLRVGVEDMDWPQDWTSILLKAIQSSEGVPHLGVQAWELLAKLTTEYSRTLGRCATYNSKVTASLLDAQEWDKLECWMGVSWMTWLSDTDDVTEDLEQAMNSLFYHQPGAVRQLTQWMDRWSVDRAEAVPVSFRRICEQAQLNTRSSPSPDEAKGPSGSSFPAQSPSFGGHKVWELLPLI